MTTDDMKNHPIGSTTTKTPLNDGTVYQIAVPRQSSSWDPSFVEQNGTTICEKKKIVCLKVNVFY